MTYNILQYNTVNDEQRKERALNNIISVRINNEEKAMITESIYMFKKLTKCDIDTSGIIKAGIRQQYDHLTKMLIKQQKN